VFIIALFVFALAPPVSVFWKRAGLRGAESCPNQMRGSIDVDVCKSAKQETCEPPSIDVEIRRAVRHVHPNERTKGTNDADEDYIREA
jgi:hypothetical protein